MVTHTRRTAEGDGLLGILAGPTARATTGHSERAEASQMVAAAAALFGQFFHWWNGVVVAGESGGQRQLLRSH